MSRARKLVAIVAALLAFVAFPALGQITFPTPNTAVNAIGQVRMCINATGNAVACQGINVTGAFSGANTNSASAMLAGAIGKTAYICGFQVNGLGATGVTTVNISVATLVGGNTANFAYTFPAGATVAATPMSQTFSPCLPANAAATPLSITVPGAVGNTSTNISAWGYQQ
jgi:hypothetical protein